MLLRERREKSLRADADPFAAVLGSARGRGEDEFSDAGPTAPEDGAAAERALTDADRDEWLRQRQRLAGSLGQTAVGAAATPAPAPVSPYRALRYGDSYSDRVTGERCLAAAVLLLLGFVGVGWVLSLSALPVGLQAAAVGLVVLATVPATVPVMVCYFGTRLVAPDVHGQPSKLRRLRRKLVLLLHKGYHVVNAAPAGRLQTVREWLLVLAVATFAALMSMAVVYGREFTATPKLSAPPAISYATVANTISRKQEQALLRHGRYLSASQLPGVSALLARSAQRLQLMTTDRGRTWELLGAGKLLVHRAGMLPPARDLAQTVRVR